MKTIIPKRVTSHNSNDQLLYFTSTSLFSCVNVLIFISDREGHPNIFARSLDTAEEWKLTSNKDGYLKSYVYFEGNAYKGFGKASVSLNPVTGHVYYIQGRQICRVDLQGQIKVLAELPGDQVTALLM